ncbi:hypothetical protein CTAYLR_001181 [Chrysophaeum taylorii]|uniref:Geranylgeranyl transferase type-2 subunit alpha n=1 Tax=Chrysophaeum taylorii TaxID=2483200 RepID=A0AAD7UPQ5_9STRA|nr:hypothetical protein CTAYLR_001181 [Chrysophaeum taylorii]
MHGRKKVKASAQEVESSRRKARNYRTVNEHVLKLRAAGDTSPATLEVLKKVLLANSDSYTLWNYRRELEANEELELTAACLRKNPKSYPTWFHREWAVRRMGAEVARKELSLCAELLNVDERNFHCWNYRRVMSELVGEDAADFAREKLESNFSNYSAFHELAASLPQKLDADRARQELDLVAQAIFTDPDDQSAWWYAECILSRTDDGAVLRAQADALRDLRELEPKAKWPAIALLRVLARLSDRWTPEMIELHALLIDMDPAHARMYGAVPINNNNYN